MSYYSQLMHILIFQWQSVQYCYQPYKIIYSIIIYNISASQTLYFQHFKNRGKMNKLIQVEACRCLAVVQDMINTLDQLQYVNPTTEARLQDTVEKIFPEEISTKYKEACKRRKELETIIQDQQGSKATQQKSRQNRLEKRKEEATNKFQKEIHDLTMMFSVSTEFIDKLKQNFTNYQDLLPNYQMTVGGQGGKSLVSASVDQTAAAGQMAAQMGTQQNFAHLKNLIQTLQHMYEVVNQNMNTSVQEDLNKKQLYNQLKLLEQDHRNNLNNYARTEKQMIENNDLTEGHLTDNIQNVNQNLQQNATYGDETVNALFDESVVQEASGMEQFLQKNKEFAVFLSENTRKIQELIQKSQTTVKDLNRSKVQQYMRIKEDVKKLDGDCEKLDQDIFRLKYQINISDGRIGELEKEIEAYKKDKAKRDADQAALDKKMEIHLEQWDLEDLLAGLELK